MLSLIFLFSQMKLMLFLGNFSQLDLNLRIFLFDLIFLFLELDLESFSFLLSLVYLELSFFKFFITVFSDSDDLILFFLKLVPVLP